MNKIIEFLQDPIRIDGHKNTINKDKLSESYHKFKNFIKPFETVEEKNAALKNKPKVNKGQIWLCKQKYYDVLGNLITGEHPYLVLLVSNEDKLDDKTFVRIQPISPFIEFKADDDILIENENITGFKFIIETWNEQPVLTGLLEEFVGKLDIDVASTNDTDINLSEEQKEFRKTEIRNTAYLRQSVGSLLEYEELNNQIPVFLNIDNATHFPEPESQTPKSIFTLNEPEQSYLLAAKKGKLINRPTYYFDETINETDVKIKIIRDKDEYILSITEPEKTEIEIKDAQGNILKPAAGNFYDGLKRGIYFMQIKDCNNEIRIILK